MAIDMHTEHRSHSSVPAPQQQQQPGISTSHAAASPPAAAAAAAAIGDPIDGRYQRIAKIGVGTYGDVYRGVDNLTGETVAVKCLKGFDDDPDGFDLDCELAAEVEALEACRGHPNIVQLIDHGRHRHDDLDNATTTEPPPEAYIVMEFVGPSLHFAVKRHGRYDEGDTRRLTRQLLAGVRWMHELGLMHRDLKPGNVLVDGIGRGGGDASLKICDLGLARDMFDDYKTDPPMPYSNPIGAVIYAAPEVLLGSTAYDQRIDTWAVGCIMAYLLKGEHLFYAMSDKEVLEKIVDVLGMDDITGWSRYWDYMIPKSLIKSGRPRRGNRLREMFAFPCTGGGLPELSEEGFEVLSGLLRCNPEKRMTAAEALQHRWFVGL
uniref:[RNA-polymerase]-subunit kinase n=1 Tax=Leersia perrieri TaxID=77586 RepID=A0A0D9XYW1_9ORYZ